jgi:hypothetical protein
MIRSRYALGLLLIVMSSACENPNPVRPGPVVEPPPPPPVSETRIVALSGNLAFGNVDVRQTKTAILTIANTGNAPLSVASITYPAAFTGDFASGTVAAGATQAVTVTFAPMAASGYSGMVTVNGNQTAGTNTIAASGAGQGTTGTPPAPAPTPAPPSTPNRPPAVSGALNTAPPPGTYFEWPMNATDPDGDDVSWSVASGNTCSFVRIVSQDSKSPSRAVAGGTAASNFSGTCQIRLQACDRHGACSPWNGSYSWNPGPPPANTPPTVGGALNSAAPPGTYFEWPMSATDHDGDEISWSAAPGHTCTFLRITSQEYRSQSRAVAGGTAPTNFSGTCQIKFQACDRHGACGAWNGSYTWNPTPPRPQGNPMFLIRNRLNIGEGRVTNANLDASGSGNAYWGVAGSISLRWDRTSQTTISRDAHFTIQWTNTTNCSLRFNGFFYSTRTGYPIQTLDFGTGFATEPGQTRQVTLKVVSIGDMTVLGFEAAGDFYNCR